MIENILTRKNCSLKVMITVKSVISLGLIVLAVVLPQIVHATVGASGGVQWLPMYLPVILAGCLLGTAWGAGIGVASPLVSFLITLCFGNPMPALARLPFMVTELAVIAAVCGLFSRKIAKNGWLAFPAVLLSFITGRIVFMALVLMFQSVTPFTPAAIWAQIQSGLLGLLLQSAFVPFAVMGLKKLLDGKND